MRGHAYAAHPKLRIPSCASVASSRRTSSSATSTSTEPSWPPWPGCTPRASSSPSSGARFLRHAARHRRHLRGCSVRSRRCSPGARYQRCTVHFYRNALGRVPVTRRKAAAHMLKAIHAQESREVCARKAEEVTEKLESMRLGTAARTMRNRFAKTLAYTEFPSEHWRQIKTNNGSSASTAKSGGGRGSSGSSRTATRSSCWWRRG